MNKLLIAGSNQPNDMQANRRSFLKGATAAGLGLTGLALSSAATSLAQDNPTIGTDPGASMMSPSNVKEFGMAQNAPAGPEFDKAYIAAQLENHEELRDLTQAYLGHPAPPKSNMAESQGRHLGTLSLATFKEHVAITQRISEELQASA